MSKQDTIEALVADFHPRSLPRPSPRDTALPALPGKADAVVGMRRSGKTWRLFQDIHERLDRGVGPGQLLYVNLEDERLGDLDAALLQDIVDAQVRAHPDALDHGLHLYLDEVQNAAGWERFVRRQLDRRDRHVTLTGSSAKLLSLEIATSLRGRALPTELLPFGFREALTFHGAAPPEAWPPDERTRVALRRAFDRHLRTGGFPEVQLLDDTLRVRVLQDYVDVVVLRDVVERHGVTNVGALRCLVRRLLDAPGCTFSVHRLYNDLRSQGRKVSKDTLYAALAHLEDAHLVFAVQLDHPSASTRSAHPRKMYPVDPALAAAHSFTAARNTGHLLEVMVYLELRRRGFSCAYGRTSSGFEVDFVARHHGRGVEQLVQVCADLSSDDTRRRELRALEEAMAEGGHTEALLITLDATDSLDTSAGTVRVLPAWRWLLER